MWATAPCCPRPGTRSTPLPLVYEITTDGDDLVLVVVDADPRPRATAPNAGLTAKAGAACSSSPSWAVPGAGSRQVTASGSGFASDAAGIDQRNAGLPPAALGLRWGRWRPAEAPAGRPAPVRSDRGKRPASLHEPRCPHPPRSDQRHERTFFGLAAYRRCAHPGGCSHLVATQGDPVAARLRHSSFTAAVSVTSRP